MNPTMMRNLALSSALAGIVAGCSVEESPQAARERPANCRETLDRYNRITVCQLDDRERWYRGRWPSEESSVTDYFKDGRIVVYKGLEAWEYSPKGIMMTDGYGNKYRVERTQ